MNIWAAMLADLPALAQRQIARHQRISLPRGADAAIRIARLRQALCHAATVRAVYANLPRPAQSALQHLRASRGGIRPTDLAARFGPIRSWRQLAADPRPRSISEQLLLLGWLLPRPSAPRHPPRYLLPPELRRWLPHPLDLAAPAFADRAAELPPALQAATTVLLACAERPQALTLAGTLRRADLRALAARLAPVPAETTSALLDWLLPLLVALDLLSARAGRASLTIAGQRFLGLSPEAQQAQLRSAWIRSPNPDAWLLRMRVNRRGIDWPLLRRRLCEWARAVPGGLPDPRSRYAALARSFGPLANAQTHGFRSVDRAPWQPRRAAAIFDTALHGPIAWLGLAGLPLARAADRSDASQGPLEQKQADPDGHPCASHEPHGPPERLAPFAWGYAAPGVVRIPHRARQIAALRLLPFARWHATDAEATSYRITPATLARAAGQGWSADACWQLLEQHAGPPPDGWRADSEHDLPPLRIVYRAVLLSEAPAQLERAGRARSVRRHLGQRVAPGIALLRAEAIGPLTRALARQSVPCRMEGTATSPAPAVATELSAGERAALLIACAHYRRHAPADAPLLPHHGLEDRLRAGLAPQLLSAVDAALAELRPAPAPASTPATSAPEGPTIGRLREALAHQRMVELTYDTGAQGAPNRRIVRPLALEQRADHWYLRAYCTARQAERTFRVDRIMAIG